MAFSLLFTAPAFADEARPWSASPAPTAEGETQHWGYIESIGPEHWGELPGASACAQGHSETPIALETRGAIPDTHLAPYFQYRPSHVHMVNNGHTVEFTYDAGSSVRVNGREYTLAQFHFHTPSEHTEDGKRFPLEMHLVHKDSNGGVVVVGVFIKEGEPNRVLDAAFSHLPHDPGAHSDLEHGFINAAALLPREQAYFQYQGSLTTPPCTEGVEWFVMTKPIEMSDAQIAAFQRLPYLNPNSRSLQPLNGRTVYLHTASR
ncbi:carbonic anhydrase [Pyxidicoccus caerfyrddinensis]|uniref:carbonic anhydrase n=1 Tax=Pyxidicoccus caerfyrddinensis TaxID=2709663 RepID=UPI001F082FDA|nr:carbonic anhydrase family protein [Pyxidicoccus caerfyrddinensis]